MSLLMGKVCENVAKNVVRVAIPQLKFDSFLNIHFRESSELSALDKAGTAKPGDWILVRKLPERISLKVEHEVEKIVYQNGRIICPLTGKRSFKYRYEKDEPSKDKSSSTKKSKSVGH